MIIQSIPNDFSVCKVEDYSLVNWRAEYVFTAKTDEENSLVCLTQDAPANTRERDDGWRALRVQGTLDLRWLVSWPESPRCWRSIRSRFLLFLPIIRIISCSNRRIIRARCRHWPTRDIRLRREGRTMDGLVCVTLRQRLELKQRAAAWFHAKWGVPEAAYLACMEAYLRAETEYGWYLCLDGGRIVGGLGVIENDFHARKDLAPNICAVYTEPAYRRRGVAGSLLNQAVADLKARGITPVYLFTDHTGFYERYGWEFFCMAQGDGKEKPSRMYIHK